MAVSYYFFDSQLVDGQHDRTYSSGDFTKYLDGLVGSGVFPIPSTSLQVYAGTGMKVLVKPGMGWINGHKMINDADIELSIDAADVTLNRIDRVVFRVDMVNRLMEIVVKKGTNGSDPIAPALTRTQDMIEYSLATISVDKQTTTITESMIRDTRLDSSVCGMVQGLIQQVGTDTLYKQWNDAYDQAIEQDQADFDEWFNSVKDTLSSAAIIRNFKNRVIVGSGGTQNAAIGISQYVKDLDILDVYLNGMRLDTTEYSIDSEGHNVTFTKTLDEGAVIEFIVLKTVDGTGAETIVGDVEKLVAQQNIVVSGHSIPASAWGSAVGTSGYYEADISHSDITADSMVNVNFVVESLAAAQDAEVLGSTTSKAGACTIYARNKPSTALTCDFVILKGGTV